MANARGIAPRPWRSMNLHTAAPPNPSDPQTRKPRPARDDEREVVVQYSLSRRRQVQNEARIARLGSPPRSRRCDEPTPHAADCLDGRGPVAELAPDRAARRAAPGPRNHLHLGRVWAAGILSGRGRTQGHRDPGTDGRPPMAPFRSTAGSSVVIRCSSRTTPSPAGHASATRGDPTSSAPSYVLAGVTSFGINSTCGGTGGVYRVDTADDLDWLAQTFGVAP